MPALDKYQSNVIRALKKVGWQVDANPYYIRVDQRAVFIDLTAHRIDEDRREQIVILEVKSFKGRSPVQDLEEAIGQYVIYRALLEESGVTYPLYLAVPVAAFETILSERIGEIVRRRLKIKVIIIDVDEEEIVQWLD